MAFRSGKAEGQRSMGHELSTQEVRMLIKPFAGVDSVQIKA